MGVIRLLLALSVVLNHSYSIFGFNLLGGSLAVQVFFIISGFYMALILNEKYVSQKGSYKLFITNRFMRIYPIYLAIFIFSVLFFSMSYQYPPSHFGLSTKITTMENPVQVYAEWFSKMDVSTFFFLVITNVCIFFQDVLMFLSMDASGDIFFTSNFRLTDLPLYKFLFIPQGWSIALECMFYLIAPFLMRRKVSVVVSIIVITFVVRFVTYYNGLANDPWSYRFFPFELGYFMLGNISYHMYKKVRMMSLPAYCHWAPFVFILLLTLSYPITNFKGSQYLYCFCFFICLPFIFFLSKNWKRDTYLGDLSYPIYLVHILLLGMMQYMGDHLDKIYIGGIYLSAVILCSILLNEGISKRIERIRQKRYAKFQKAESN